MTGEVLVLWLTLVNINYPSPTRSVCEDTLVDVCVCVST